MVSSEDGSAFTGTVTVYVTGDGGTQAIGTVGSGICTHEGNGLHTYLPAQAETNYTHIAFTFIGTGAVPVTIQVYTNIDTQLLDIQSRLPATLDSGNMRSSVQSIAADTLTASALAADAVAEIAAAVGGSGGSGARTVTITVTLNSNAVEGATVRLTKSAETYTGTTNASGVVTFNVDDGTWTVAITAAGASFAGASLVVDGNETQTYTLTATSITPSSTGLVTGYWVCYSHIGVVESGVSITMICKKVPAESGFALDSATRTATSGADGIAQFANLIPGATYQVARGSGQNFMIKVPDDATGTVELNSILGT